jgi:hypothetical protein
MIPKSIQYKIAAVFVVLWGVYLASSGSDTGKQVALLEKKGVTVPGIIESAKKSGRRRSTECMVVATFATQSGEPRKAEFEVTSSFFESRTSGQGMMGMIVNPNIEVRYLQTNPNVAMIVGGSINHSSDFWFGIVVALAGIGGLIYLFVYDPFAD